MAAKKKVKKKKVKKAVPLEEKVTKKVKEKEDRQLRWFFFWVIVVFAAFIVPYLYGQSLKKFELEGMDFFVEENGNLIFYHSRFKSLDGGNVNFNIYLHEDPRENMIPVEGELNRFKYGGYMSFSEEFDMCRGDVTRAIVDLGSFMKKGIGVGPLEAGISNGWAAANTGKKYVDCTTNLDRTVVILELGEEGKVVQNTKNKYCYTIYVEDCEDITPIEKFITQTVIDMREAQAK